MGNTISSLGVSLAQSLRWFPTVSNLNTGRSSVIKVENSSPSLRPYSDKKICAQGEGSNAEKKPFRKSVLNHHTHLKLQTGEKKQIFRCHKCPQRFLHDATLRVHLFQHLTFQEKVKIMEDKKLITPRPTCPKCGKSFSQKGYLIVHDKTVHLRVKEWPCPKCERLFSTKTNMTSHLATVHSVRLAGKLRRSQRKVNQVIRKKLVVAGI